LLEKNELDDKPKDYLEESPFNFALELLQKMVFWPLWAIVLGGCLLSAIVFASWFLVNRFSIVAIIAAVIFGLYIALDASFLWLLPRQQVSFGQWQSQLGALAIPRLVGAVAIAFLAIPLGDLAGLVLLAIGQLAGSIILVYGAVVEPFKLSMTSLDIGNQGESNSGRPIRILHISDLHIERIARREFKVLELVEQAHADLIVITGDYVNLSYRRDPQTHDQVRWFLNQLSAPYGVYATLGSPLVDLRDVVPPLFDDLQIRLMLNEWEEVKLDDSRSVIILGLDCSHHLPTDRAMLDKLVEASPNGGRRILLYHAPDLMPEASDHNIDLYLCGHTHGGQVRLPGYGAILTSSIFGKRYEMGSYEAGQTCLYVSRGVGLEGLSAPRVRFLAPPEITLINMHVS
jgi:predicted MPP superfamily phosphohydrolase